MSQLPRILIVDDLFGRTHTYGRNDERAHLCLAYQLKDVTGDQKEEDIPEIDEAVAEAVFYRGQNPNPASIGDVVKNDLKGTIQFIRTGWENPPYWSIVFLDLCFHTGAVTAMSEKTKGPGMPEGRTEDDNPKSYFGLSLLEHIQREFPDLPIVMLSSKHGNVTNPMLANMGAFAFLPRGEKGSKERLADCIRLFGLIPDEAEDIVGNSKHVLLALKESRAAAQTQQNVLIYGERGSGKTLFAQYIHKQSRRTSPFVTVHSLKLTAEELDRYVQEAADGDIYLSRIEDISSNVQEHMLSILSQNGLNVRFLASTNSIKALRNVKPELIRRFEEGGRIFVPPLRERLEDIQLLADKFVKDLSIRPHRLDKLALEKLHAHQWPENISELKRYITKAVRRFPESDFIVARHLEIPRFDMSKQIRENLVSGIKVVLIGNKGSGKSTAINAILGIRAVSKIRTESGQTEKFIEPKLSSFLFVIDNTDWGILNVDTPLLKQSNIILYFVDAHLGWQAKNRIDCFSLSASYGNKLIIVISKVDTESSWQEVKKQISHEIAAPIVDISSLEGRGIDELRVLIDKKMLVCREMSNFYQSCNDKRSACSEIIRKTLPQLFLFGFMAPGPDIVHFKTEIQNMINGISSIYGVEYIDVQDSPVDIFQKLIEAKFGWRKIFVTPIPTILKTILTFIGSYIAWKIDKTLTPVGALAGYLISALITSFAFVLYGVIVGYDAKTYFLRFMTYIQNGTS